MSSLTSRSTIIYCRHTEKIQFFFTLSDGKWAVNDEHSCHTHGCQQREQTRVRVKVSCRGLDYKSPV